MTTQQPEALRLADQLIANYPNIYTGLAPSCANELRRLHAESELHKQELASYRIASRDVTIKALDERIEGLGSQLAAVQQGEHTMAHTSVEQQIAAAWNAQADEFNQWSELDLGEKIEWAAKWGAARGRICVFSRGGLLI